MIDIQVYDTFFVFIGSRWGNLFFAPFFMMMVETWVLHIILRRKGRFSGRWRWIQVMTTVIPWLAIVTILVIPRGNFASPHGTYLDYSNFEQGGSIEGTIYVAPLIVFIVSQLVFWVVAIIRIISARSGHHRALEKIS